MTSFTKLYTKEIRENAGLFVFALVIIILDIVYGAATFDESMARKERGLRMIPVELAAFSTLLVPPLILIHAYSSERRSGSRFQLYALPVSRPMIGLSKLIASLTYGLVMAVVTLVLIDILFSSQWLKMSPHPGLRSTAYEVILSFYVAYSIFLLGMVTFSESFGETCLPYKRVAIGAVAAFSFYLYWRCFEQAIDGLSFLGQIELGPGHGMLEIAWFAYPAGVGIFLFGAGCYVLHRHSDI